MRPVRPDRALEIVGQRLGDGAIREVKRINKSSIRPGLCRRQLIGATSSASTSAISSSSANRSEEHTSELQSLMRSSYAVFCLKKNKNNIITIINSDT